MDLWTAYEILINRTAWTSCFSSQYVSKTTIITIWFNLWLPLKKIDGQLNPFEQYRTMIGNTVSVGVVYALYTILKPDVTFPAVVCSAIKQKSIMMPSLWRALNHMRSHPKLKHWMQTNGHVKIMFLVIWIMLTERGTTANTETYWKLWLSDSYEKQ